MMSPQTSQSVICCGDFYQGKVEKRRKEVGSLQILAFILVCNDALTQSDHLVIIILIWRFVNHH